MEDEAEEEEVVERGGGSGMDGLAEVFWGQ